MLKRLRCPPPSPGLHRLHSLMGGEWRRSLDQHQPAWTTQMRALWLLSVPPVLWESGGQGGGRWGEEVRGFRGWWGDIVWRGAAEFGDKASVVWLKWVGTTWTLWHCGLTKIHTPCDVACWPRHLLGYDIHERENRITDLVGAFRSSVDTFFSVLDIC